MIDDVNVTREEAACQVTTAEKSRASDRVKQTGRNTDGSTGRASVIDVAARAGVSPMTVSRVVNNPDLVSPELRDRVQRAVRELGYIPNRAAAGLQSNRNRIVGFLMPDLSVPLYRQMHVGLTAALEPLGYSILVVESRYSPERERSLAQVLLGWNPSGVVRVATGANDDIRQLFRKSRVPCCEFVDSNDESCELGAGFSHEEVGFAVGDHLCRTGRSRLVVVMPRAVPRFEIQFQGIRRAVRKFPGSRVERIILRVPSPLNMSHGTSVIQQLYNDGLPADALVFLNDTPAIGALFECRRLQIDVPQRLAIVGFGDHEIASHVIPSLTTVSVDGEQLGRRCGELVLRNGTNARPKRIVDKIGFDFIRRESA